MHCPFCAAADTKVLDSRVVESDLRVRRRRQCTTCHERFSTNEVVEYVLPRIIKRNQNRESFHVDKLRYGLLRSLEKRPVPSEKIELLLDRVKQKLVTCGAQEILSSELGEWVMDELKNVDEVAYVRFASVYRSFKDVQEFRDEIDRMLTKTR